MANYAQVQEALQQGMSPALLCSTCPWDRFCITPPEMTKAEIDAKQAEAARTQEEQAAAAKARGEESNGMGMILGTLMTSMLYVGKDLQATVCPVLTARMRSSEGRAVVDGVRAMMKSWDDSAVSLA